MLTVRNQITPANVARYLPEESMQSETKAFCAQCSQVNPLPADVQRPLIGSHVWALKAILYTCLRAHFVTHDFSALLFPQVLYVGTPTPTDRGLIASPMLHWLVLCRFADQNIPTSEVRPNRYLSNPSVSAREILGQGVLSWDYQAGENIAAGGTPDVLRWLGEHGNDILNGI
jgi:hypothetical protein